MEQNSNNNNMESYDSKSETVMFNPVEVEKARKTIPPEREIEEVLYYADDEEDDYEEEKDSSGTNGILIGLVIVLVILFIAAIIWGTVVLNNMKKKEEAQNTPSEEVEEVIPEDEFEEEAEEILPEEGEKIVCKITFKSGSVEEEEDSYTVRAIFKDEDNKYYTKRITIDADTEIKEDGDNLSYKSFVNNVIEKLGSKEVEFDGVIDKESNHIDSISYKSEILEDEDEGIILPVENEENSEEESTEENTPIVLE